jgi:hypothetical protein
MDNTEKPETLQEQAENFLIVESSYAGFKRMDDCEYVWDEVIQWMTIFASQQNEALQAEIEQMHKECYGWADIVGNQDKKILEKDARISQLEEALRELLHNSVNDKGFPQIATAIQLRKAQKALSQNNQPEK